MKKIIFPMLSLLIMMASCSQDDSLVASNASQSDELEYLEDNYETQLKGYSVAGPKAESLSDERDIYEKALHDLNDYHSNVLDETYSKSNVSTRAFNDTDYPLKVGILKYTTCGSYPELHYHQDNQDGGWTSISANIGETKVDDNKNMEWKFCVVPGATSLNGGVVSSLRSYGGGVLVLAPYKWTEIDGVVNVFIRYHDDEDSSNKNSIKKNTGNLYQDPKGYIGETCFTKNTRFVWLFNGSSTKNTSLGFNYGVISNDLSGPKISIDDEDKNNENYAWHLTHTNSGKPSSEKYNVSYAGIYLGDQNTYYHVKIY